MKNSVVIKGNQYGIVAVLDPDKEFSLLKEEIIRKFSESKSFFKDAQMAISFEGRILSIEEEKQILDIISEYTDMQIICIIDNDSEKEMMFRNVLDQSLADQKLKQLKVEASVQANLSDTEEEGKYEDYAQFHKGILRSGAYLEFEGSGIIIGDVNAGAKVVARGNIIVLGSLKGIVHAGITGNTNAFVIALDMRPNQIRISNSIARSPDKPIKDPLTESRIAYLEEGNIYIEPLNKDILNDITI